MAGVLAGFKSDRTPMGSVGEGSLGTHNAKPYTRTCEAIPPGRVGSITPAHDPDTDQQHEETVYVLHSGSWWPDEILIIFAGQ